MSSSLKFDLKELIDGLEQLQIKTKAALLAYGNTQASSLESYMKTNAPWTDRSGEARRRLSAKCEPTSKGIRIVMAHGVSYGWALETAHEKRYAILEPTLRIKGNEIVSGFNTLLTGMGYKGK